MMRIEFGNKKGVIVCINCCYFLCSGSFAGPMKNLLWSSLQKILIVRIVHSTFLKILMIQRKIGWINLLVIDIPSSLKESLKSSWDHREGEKENERMRVSLLPCFESSRKWLTIGSYSKFHRQWEETTHQDSTSLIIREMQIKASFFGSHPALWSNSHIHTWLLEKP